MGAGKTSVGKALAKRLRKEFFDTDQEVERATGVRIPVIFEIEGETGFRAREARVLGELVLRKNVVLATGGGVILSADNRRLLMDNGMVIYLRASIDELRTRTRYDKNRPLLHTDDPVATLKELFEHRDPLYREVASLIVDTGSQSVGSLANSLEKRLQQHARGCDATGSAVTAG